MNDASIRFSSEGHIARIVLNRPGQHNALGAAEISQLHDRLAAIDADPAIRVLLLTGSGQRTFCAGASLSEFRSGDMNAGLFTTLTDRLARLRVPSVCALNGSVFGGGAEIALCCDYRIGVTGSRLLVPAARIGLCYPLNGLQRYVDKLGLSVAKRILVASEELDADTLLAIGFLHRVVQPDSLQAQSEAFAAHLAGLAPLAVQAMKRILGGIADGSMDPAEANRLADACAASADLREGLAAQRERRTARFSGS
ncbi:MAG: enoyl-CoA hydratase/isomerase family protein [Gammaproteobacteria bacterium]|jgi:enoyl-CoA hydratase/carnithine racemase|nr:enoyl-CoA hydratase/isomerase family protein [Gammaproteobacteria bacterium]MBP6052360.1 enoyl-CoA hydratase/isomerase family protein [Pseudomonadales bacterium]MBK6584810.1 enoyl-CoA hydratase/isomerase family protein [Gammaproteobacteria bacterium]MBK7169985.1 enoyl-CoA hydratase/isomerase family protein [Gammaproteobacteria bacterium]MBK7519679.1 enoyl-CoA hydratase/isomerase family protein [Gammaproteobacteria bacterium]